VSGDTSRDHVDRAAGEPTERTRLRREPQRGSHDLALINEIVDAAPICHLGLTDVDGHPLVVPTIHARIDDVLYVHGSAASRALRRLAGGIEACCTITHLDGLVVARSGFWSSMNYRSVMIFGRARLVDDPDEAMRALDAIVDHVLPGRPVEIRRPTPKEIAATKVIALPLDEASAKVRIGDPKDDPADVDTDVWAGTVPLRLVAGAPVPAANLAAHVPVPPSVIAASGG
jgi:nitroimidazol reductase NimA-like FMN-containing flavoprotein (pyridoxamine 5'-phosphate oxidase superfamily)